MKWHTQRCHDSSKALLKGQGVGGGPNPGNLCPFPQIVGIILPLNNIRNYPAYIKTNHAIFCGRTHRLRWCTHCGVFFSLNVNKSTSYPSLCLSLNSLCDETSRTWASLDPEARYCGFWLGLNPSHVGTSPKQDFSWIWVPARWVQVPICKGFTLASSLQSPGYIVLVHAKLSVTSKWSKIASTSAHLLRAPVVPPEDLSTTHHPLSLLSWQGTLTLSPNKTELAD